MPHHCGRLSPPRSLLVFGLVLDVEAGDASDELSMAWVAVRELVGFGTERLDLCLKLVLGELLALAGNSGV
jgi:hypothetical protein